MNSLKIKKGDLVQVTVGQKGKDGKKGKQGKVIAVYPEANRVIVDGVNLQKHHTKAKNAKSQGGIIEQAGPIDASNVRIVCPKTGKAGRIGYTFDENGKKIRVCRTVVDGVLTVTPLDKAVKADKKAAAKADKAPKKSTAKKADATETAEKPVKKATKASKAKTEKADTAEA